MKNSPFLRIVKWLWLALVLLAAGWFFYKQRVEVLKLLREIEGWRILCALLLLFGGKALLALFVQYSLAAEGWNPGWRQSLNLYASSALSKYIPGAIWQFVSRIGQYKLHGLGNKAVARALLLENIWLISSAMAVGSTFFCLARFDVVSGFLKIPNQSSLALVFALLILALWLAGLYLLRFIFGKHSPQKTVSPLLIFGIGLLIWTLIAGSFFMLFEGFSIDKFPLFVGGYSISWVAGYVAVFAPGGIGVREAVLAFVFAGIASLEQISVNAVMNRIIWLTLELIMGLPGLIKAGTALETSDNADPAQNPSEEEIRGN